MDALAAVCEAVASSTGRLRKAALLRDYFRTLSDEDFARAVRFLSGGPFAASDPRKLSIGGAILREAVAPLTPWEPDILRLCYREVGDTGETIGLLVSGRTEDRPLTLAEAEAYYLQLYECRRTAQKLEILRRVFVGYRPLAIKYFVKVITGNLRIGLLARTVEEAVAAATGMPAAGIRSANNSSGDLAKVAIAARRGALYEIEAALFHPMEFMLAKPVDATGGLPDPGEWAAENKFDGIRAQIHAENGRVRIYTRGLEDATESFPELIAAMRVVPGSLVLDGEILAWRGGRALPFNIFQQRIARKKVVAKMLSEIPVVFIAYDLLYRDGELLLEKPIEERRALLEEVFAAELEYLKLSRRYFPESKEDVERMFGEARAAGNEGLVLKRRGSLYEAGRRSGQWLKLKRPYGTLDVVITAAEQGHGKRATVLSGYTFAVRSGDRFVNVGKAYSGLTDQEIRELTRILRGLSTDRFGRIYLVKPEVVLEVAFDGVQKSARHKGGYALRFPRIIRWRRDKEASEADTLERVEELYSASLRLDSGTV